MGHSQRNLLMKMGCGNRIIRSYMDIEAIRDRNVLLRWDVYAGKVYGRSPMMNAIPMLIRESADQTHAIRDIAAG